MNTLLSQERAGAPQAAFPFLESKDIPPHVYEPLLSWMFETHEFQQWLLRGSSWQFRVIGEPGSGKTTLSAMTVAYLRKAFQGQNVPVISIFFTQATSEDRDIVHHFLQSILRQLKTFSKEEEIPSIQTPSVHDLTPKSHCEATIDELREVIYSRLSDTPNTFLIVDDIDLCNQSVSADLELELSTLQQHGLSIMITSRLSIWHNENAWACDIAPEHAGIQVEIFWCCSNCHDQDLYDSGDDVVIICQVCKNDYVCPTCEPPSKLYEPYKYIDSHLGRTPDTAWEDFIATEIELEHGDVGLDSSLKEKPPLSKLGRALIAASNDTANAAVRLRDKIIQDSVGNISVAKLRLEAYRDAQSVEQVERYDDRLPDNIVATFDATITAIENKPKADQDVALRAISGAANTRNFYGKAFEELQRWMLRQARRESDAHIESARFSVDEVLRATNGLIQVDYLDGAPVTPFHPAFTMYVTEKYNSALFWTSAGMLDTDELSFAKPRRVETWGNASRKPRGGFNNSKGDQDPLMIKRLKRMQTVYESR